MTKNLKKQVLQDLFEIRTVRADQSKDMDGFVIVKSIDYCNGRMFTIVRFGDKKLEQTVLEAVRKYAHAVDGNFDEARDEILQVAWVLAWETIASFRLEEGATWENVLSGKDKRNRGRLVKAICTRIERQMAERINVDSHRTTTTIDGERAKVIYVMKYLSLDAAIDPHDEDAGTLHDVVDRGFWDSYDGYQANHFLQWFRENKERILTKSQLKSLEKLVKCSGWEKSMRRGGYTPNDVREVAGIDSKNGALRHFLKRVEKRVLKAYAKEQVQSMREMELRNWHDRLNDILDETNHEAFSRKVYGLLNIDHFNDLIYDLFVGEDTKRFVKCVKSGATMPRDLRYRIGLALDYELERIERALAEIETRKAREQQAQDKPRKRRTPKKTVFRTVDAFGVTHQLDDDEGEELHAKDQEILG